MLQIVLRCIGLSRESLGDDDPNATKELSSVPARRMKDLLVERREQKWLLITFFVRICYRSALPSLHEAEIYYESKGLFCNQQILDFRHEHECIPITCGHMVLWLNKLDLVLYIRTWL